MSFKFEIGQELVLARNLNILVPKGAKVLIEARKERYFYSSAWGQEIIREGQVRNRYKIRYKLSKNENLHNVSRFTYAWEDELIEATKNKKNNYY